MKEPINYIHPMNSIVLFLYINIVTDNEQYLNKPISE